MKKIFTVGHHYFCASLKRMGIGTFYSSPSVTPDESFELEQKSTFLKPSLLPSNPSGEEIQNNYPINYAFHNLICSGKSVLLHSKYTGKNNHTPERFGNFLSHSVLFNENLLKVKIPLLFESIDFRQSLNSKEEVNFIPGFDSIEIDISDIEQSSHLEKYLTFLNGDLKRLNAFCITIDSVIDGWICDRGKSICILGNKDEVKEIIFSLFSLLPSCVINHYSFATYIEDPQKYSFQIAGIIPESGHKSIDKTYIKLISLSDINEEYIPKHSLTSYLKEIISLPFGSSIKLNEFEILIEKGGFLRLDESLNHIARTLSFKEKIATENLANLCRILNQENNNSKKDNLLLFVYEQNSKLFLDYIQFELGTKITTLSNFTDVGRLLNDFYHKYFEPHPDFLESNFYNFFNYVKSLLHGPEHEYISVELLANYETSKFLGRESINNELAIVDVWFEKQKDRVIFEKLNQKLNHLISNSYKNLYSMKISIEIQQLLESGNFFTSLENFSEHISLLSSNEMSQLFEKAILIDNKIGRFDLSFRRYIPWLEKFFDKEKYNFWVKLLSKNESQADGMYTYSYLRRRFAIAVLGQREYHEIINMLIVDDYEKRWVFEFVQMNGDFEKYKILESIIIVKKGKSNSKQKLKKILKRFLFGQYCYSI